MSDENSRNWLTKIIVSNLIVMLAAALVFYGVTTATNQTQNRDIQELKEYKANKELVNHQYNEIIKRLDDLTRQIDKKGASSN